MRNLFKCHGGKTYLKSWILDHFPSKYEDMVYVEPYVGGGSVVLNKRKGIREVVNDLDETVYLVWKMLKEDGHMFMDRLRSIPYCEESFLSHLGDEEFFGGFRKTKGKHYVEFDRAVGSYVRRRMSRGGMEKTFSWSERLRGGIPGDENGWNNAILNLPLISKRIKDMDIFNKEAVVIIMDFDSPNTMFYLDPPYLHSTRISKNSYRFEMNEIQHTELLQVILNCQGKFLLSGYNSELYNRTLRDWNKVEKVIKNHSGQGKKKQSRTECLWRNY